MEQQKQKQKQKDYQENGYAVYPGYISLNQIAEINLIIDDLQKTLPVSDTVFDESGTGKIKQIQYLDKRHTMFQTLSDTLRNLAEEITGESDLTVLNMQLFEKHPDISKPTRSHQDNAYFKISPPIALTFWLSLDHIDETNGALYYAPKTHLLPTRKHQRYHQSTTFRIRSGVPGLSLCLHEHPEEYDVIMKTQPGDLLVHNCNTIHRAGKNTSDRRRRAIGVVFIPTRCVPDPVLTAHFKKQLKEDIELQEYKDPLLYQKFKQDSDNP